MTFSRVIARPVRAEAIAFLTLIGIIFLSHPAGAADSYMQDFSGFATGASIDGLDYWKVFSGSPAEAIVQNDITFPGKGQALELGATPDIVGIGRSTSYFPDISPVPDLYGNVSPTWVRLRVRPGYSKQTPAPPATGIAAVTLDYAGRLLATNSGVWVDTGSTYRTDRWYDVLLKLDFTTHSYDLYFFDASSPSPEFVPVKTGLKFTDETINSLNDIILSGAYTGDELDAEVYVDSLAVTYIYRLQVISLPQKLFMGRPSGLISVQLQDFNADPQTAVEDITLDLKSTSGTGKFSLQREPWEDVTQIVLPKYSQMISFYYKDNTLGKPIINISEYPEQGFLDGLQEMEIVSEAAAFEVQAETKQVAGVAFKARIIAQDDEGNTNINYNGTVVIDTDYVSPDSGNYKITPAELGGFTDGVLEANLTYADCGLISITVRDAQSQMLTGTSQNIMFLPFDLTVTAQADQVTAAPFGLNITARNAELKTAPNYNTPVKLYPVGVTPADITGGLLIPQLIDGELFSGGTVSANVSYNYYGTIKIRAEDTVDTTKQGISGELKFKPKAVTVSVEYPAARDFFYVGEPVPYEVKIIDALNNPIANYTGTIGMSGSGSNISVPLDYSFTAQDAGSRKFFAATTEAGTHRITVMAEQGTLSAVSSDIIVKDVYLEVIDTTSPIGTGEVIVQLVDEDGNVITSENELPIGVTSQEENDNSSAFLPGTSIPLKNGQALIPITNTESEVVTLTPNSPYLIKVRKGKITFGPIGRSGINELLWRELKTK